MNEPESGQVDHELPLRTPTEPGARTGTIKRALLLFLTLVPWLTAVALFSLLPELPRIPGVSEDLAAVAGHFLVYAVLAALIYRLHIRVQPGPDRRPIDSALIAAGGSAVIGLGFEWSQQLFTSTRTFQFEDVVANTTGAVTVSTALLLLEIAGSRLRLLLPTVFLTGAGLVSLAAVSYVIWNPALPYAGDHWHVGYRVAICGDALPWFPASPGSIHTHGQGVIHIHPQGNGDEGKDANLAAFMRFSGGNLTNDSLTLPNGETYSNGDTCPDGSIGIVTASQFDADAVTRFDTTKRPANYVPRDHQLVIIEFGPDPS